MIFLLTFLMSFIRRVEHILCVCVFACKYSNWGEKKPNNVIWHFRFWFYVGAMGTLPITVEIYELSLIGLTLVFMRLSRLYATKFLSNYYTHIYLHIERPLLMLSNMNEYCRASSWGEIHLDGHKKNKNIISISYSWYLQHIVRDYHKRKTIEKNSVYKFSLSISLLTFAYNKLFFFSLSFCTNTFNRNEEITSNKFP